jgi:hypothetical protein
MDRRRYPRLQLKLKCTLATLPNGSGAAACLLVPGMIRDISRGGFLIDLDPGQPAAITCGTPVRVEIEMPELVTGFQRSLHCAGVVVRVERSPHGTLAGAIAVQNMGFGDRSRNPSAEDFTQAPEELLM